MTRYAADLHWPQDRHALHLVKGRQVEAVPTVIHERDAVIKTLEAFIERLGAQTARKLMLGLLADRAPMQADLRAIPTGRSFVHFKIVKRS